MIVENQPRVNDMWSPVGRSQKTQDYFVPRPVEPTEVDYWAPTRDPDGVLRDRLTADERAGYLDNVREELAEVRTYIPGTVIDVGCGPGWFLQELSDWPRRIGVEPSQRAAKQLRSHNISHISDIRDITDRWAYSADLVVCLQTIEHIPNPLRIVAGIRKVLKAGGRLIISTPDFDSPCAQRFGEKYRMLHDPTHCSLFTRDSMSRLLLDFGFGIDAIRYPFPEKFATTETFARWGDTSKMSPPWPGNWMTFYCKRRLA